MFSSTDYVGFIFFLSGCTFLVDVFQDINFVFLQNKQRLFCKVEIQKGLSFTQISLYLHSFLNDLLLQTTSLHNAQMHSTSEVYFMVGDTGYPYDNISYNPIFLDWYNLSHRFSNYEPIEINYKAVMSKNIIYKTNQNS